MFNLLYDYKGTIIFGSFGEFISGTCTSLSGLILSK